jgi:hypothetical protein
MEGTKKWYESAGVWGGILAVAAPLVGGFFGLTIEQADVSEAAIALGLVGAGIGGLVAVGGRIAARKQIG